MDPNAFSSAVVDIVRGFLERELDPALARLDAFEQRFAALPVPKDGEPGKSVTVADVAPLILSEVQRVAATVQEHVSGAVTEAVSRLPPAKDGEDGKSVTIADIAPLISAEVERVATGIPAKVAEALTDAVAKLPAPEKGEDADPSVVAALVRAEIAGELKAIGDAVAAIEPAPELPDIPAMIEDAVAASEARVMLQTNAMIDKRVELGVASLPKPENGKDADPDVVRQMVADAIAALPPAVPGKDADPADVKRLVDEAVAALPPAAPGKDADPEQIAFLVRAETERILTRWERPKDGSSVTVEQVAPMIDDAVQKAVAALPVPKDGRPGIDAMDVMIDRDGNLVFTMSDGRIKSVGLVVGKDGLDVDMVALDRQVREMIAAAPKPKDGLDGVGFDDLDLAETAEGVFLRCARGDVVKEWRLPIVVDRGVWKEGQTYRRGDGVTWGGSFHIAQGETANKPDTKDGGWRLAVKRGRDGKDGVFREAPKLGPVKVG